MQGREETSISIDASYEASTSGSTTSTSVSDDHQNSKSKQLVKRQFAFREYITTSIDVAERMKEMVLTLKNVKSILPPGSLENNESVFLANLIEHYEVLSVVTRDVVEATRGRNATQSPTKNSFDANNVYAEDYLIGKNQISKKLSQLTSDDLDDLIDQISDFYQFDYSNQKAKQKAFVGECIWVTLNIEKIKSLVDKIIPKVKLTEGEVTVLNQYYIAPMQRLMRIKNISQNLQDTYPDKELDLVEKINIICNGCNSLRDYIEKQGLTGQNLQTFSDPQRISIFLTKIFQSHHQQELTRVGGIGNSYARYKQILELIKKITLFTANPDKQLMALCKKDLGLLKTKIEKFNRLFCEKQFDRRVTNEQLIELAKMVNNIEYAIKKMANDQGIEMTDSNKIIYAVLHRCENNLEVKNKKELQQTRNPFFDIESFTELDIPILKDLANIFLRRIISKNTSIFDQTNNVRKLKSLVYSDLFIQAESDDLIALYVFQAVMTDIKFTLTSSQKENLQERINSLLAIYINGNREAQKESAAKVKNLISLVNKKVKGKTKGRDFDIDLYEVVYGPRDLAPTISAY